MKVVYCSVSIFICLFICFYLYRFLKYRSHCYQVALKHYPWYNCCACGKNLLISSKDSFSVNSVLKSYFSITRSTHLCLACFESKLGRKLVFHDLTNCGQNYLLNPYTRKIILSHYASSKKGKAMSFVAYMTLISSYRDSVSETSRISSK